MREEFARTCFETLLQFSLLEDVDSMTTENGTQYFIITCI